MRIFYINISDIDLNNANNSYEIFIENTLPEFLFA